MRRFSCSPSLIRNCTLIIGVPAGSFAPSLPLGSFMESSDTVARYHPAGTASKPLDSCAPLRSRLRPICVALLVLVLVGLDSIPQHWNCWVVENITKDSKPILG